MEIWAGEIAIVVEAQLRDSISTEQYLKEFYQLQKNETPGELIRAILGKPPVWTGYGVVKQKELRYIKQSPVVLAKKRAESDATNQRFDLPFSDDALADDIAPDITGLLENGTTNDSEAVIVEGVTTEKPSAKQLIAELGFDLPPEEPAPDEEAMPIEIANAMEMHGNDGKKYGSCTNDELQERVDILSESLKGEKTTSAQNKILCHLDNISLVLDWRKQHQS